MSIYDTFANNHPVVGHEHDSEFGVRRSHETEQGRTLPHGADGVQWLETARPGNTQRGRY